MCFCVCGVRRGRGSWGERTLACVGGEKGGCGEWEMVFKFMFVSVG